MKQLNLFDEPFTFERDKKEVKYTVETIKVNGEWFDLEDLYNTLYDIKSDDVMITNKQMCEKMKELNVLNSCGSSRAGIGAGQGQRFDEFYELIKKMMMEVYDGTI